MITAAGGATTLTDEQLDALAAAIARHLADAQRDRLVDPDNAAAILGVTRRWVLDAARRGAIPHIRLGAYVRFDPAAILDWARTNHAHTGTPKLRRAA